MKRHILEFLPNELHKYLIQINEKKYRTKQILNWIYANKTLNFHNMSTLPESLREVLTRDLDNYLPQILKVDISSDGTKKYLLSLADSVKC